MTINNHITDYDEDEVFWEPTKAERREMARKIREEKLGKNKNKSYEKPSDLGPQIKKKFHTKELAKIHPKTETQNKVCRTFRQTEKDLFIHGSAGTGKTYISAGLGIEHVLEGKYDKLIIVRSVVPSRDIGFLPGDETEKTAVYEAPYIPIFAHLFGGAKSYENLKEIGKIEFMTTSFLRGLTWDNAIILVDECMNMTFSELDTIYTRIGENSRIIFCGDYQQSDLLNKKHDQSGFIDFKRIIEHMGDFEIIRFTPDDVVRSGKVKKYLKIKEELFANNEE